MGDTPQSGTAGECRVPPERLRWFCEPERFEFETTAELGDCPINIIGQPRAMNALQLGFELRSDGYNIFVAGEMGTGRSTAVRQIVSAVNRNEPAPEDLVYVHNFADSDRPRLLAFPSGAGCAFRRQVRSMVEGLRSDLVALFESDFYRERRTAVIERTQTRHKEHLKQFEATVQQEGFTLVQMQLGPVVRPALMPLIAGKPADLDQVEQMVEEGHVHPEELERLRTKHRELSGKLDGLTHELRGMQRELAAQLEKLDRELAEPLARDSCRELREKCDDDAVRDWLDQLESNILERLAEFRQLAEADEGGDDDQEQAREQLMMAYKVNVLVDNARTRGRPVVWETSPSYRNLFGAVEKSQDRSSQWQTDHTRIKAGSLLRANGGYLVADALDVLVEPGVWPALKRTLRTQKLEIQTFDPLNLFPGVSLTPEPVHLDVKLILIGTPQMYRMLYALDEDFKKIFKVKAEFALETPLSEEEVNNYACFVQKKCRDEGLPPFHREAVANVVETGVRLAGRKEKLTTRFKVIADVIRESGYWAKQEGAKVVRASHVDRALLGRRRRVDLLEERLRERVECGEQILDLAGSKIGQVNGLAVLDLGDHAFGQPSRITAVTAVGRAGIIDIERQAEMSGTTHTKGMLILSGFLRERFAQDKPLALAASVTFEQSYGMIDGDSASSAELYALLSSLSGIPLRQGIAVTGSVNQKGEVQPIGGVNQKIEGFFDLCKIMGLDGEQGVMVPTRNLEGLMLRREVVEAVREGRFHVYAVDRIEQGIEVLTGVPAGEPRAGGGYTDGSVFARADARLLALVRGLREHLSPWSPEASGS